MAARSGGANYIVQNVMYTVSRSKYGKRLPQTATRGVLPARHFTAATGMPLALYPVKSFFANTRPVVDPQIKRNLQRQLAEAQEHLRLVEEEERELSNADKEIQAAHKAYKEAHVSIDIAAKVGSS